MKNKTYYTVYKVTNKVDGKIYIGCHKTKNLDDGYMGSGKYLKRAIEKHGIVNFTKEIMFIYDNPEDMFLKESELVNEDFLTDNNTYNLKLGGEGGFDFLNKDTYENFSHSIPHMKKMEYVRKTKYPNGTFHGRKHSQKTISKMKSSSKSTNKQGFLGKSHTTETKQKISDITRFTSKGEKNSQYGTRWIHSLKLKLSKKIDKNDPLPQGWFEGRKIKWD